MRCLLASLGVLMLAAIAGCGGNVDGGSQEDAGDDKSSEPDSETSGSKPEGTRNPDADTELGSCKLGPSAYEDVSGQCAWVAEERCYATREMACNCACPREHDSQCVSGFDEGPNGRVWVACN